MTGVTVYSVFQSNISDDVVIYQRKVVQRFLPKGWQFNQFCHNMSHGDALKHCVESNEDDYTVFLDIDCIPLSPQSFPYLLDTRWSVKKGALVGCAQRANHINNGRHIYVGPFCMALKNSTYKELGSPSFHETQRGDVGEELTYTWENAKKPLYFFWPSDTRVPLWNLIEGISEFGLGTTYEDLFYHTFCIRNSKDSERMFVEKCQQILSLEFDGEQEKELLSK